MNALAKAPREWREVAEACAALACPPAHRVGDFLVRAVAASGRTGGVACGGARSEGEHEAPFAILAAPVITAGWRWARALHPTLRRLPWGANPAERWARLELAAGTAVNRASMVEAMRARTTRWTVAQQAEASRAWQYADGLQRRARGLWLEERTQLVVACTGIALALAVYAEGELRLVGYVDG